MKKMILLLAVTLTFLMLSGCSLSCEDAYDTVLVENGNNDSEDNGDTRDNEQDEDDDEDETELPSDFIKDANLEEALREQLGKPEGDLTREDMKSLEEIDFSGRGIDNISGLEYAVNLKNINLRANNIRDISPLGNLKKLETLNLDRNQVADITPVGGLGKLEALELRENMVESICNVNWDSMLALSFLDIRYNFIDIEDPEVKALIDSLYESGVDVWHDQPEHIFDEW